MKRILFFIFLTYLNVNVKAQTSNVYNDLQEVKNKMETEYPKDKYQNIALKDDIIHIFLDENCQPIYLDFPTTARDGDKFQIHIFSSRKFISSFKYIATGTYVPTALSADISSKAVEKEEKDSKDNKLFEIKSQIFGPYTGSFKIEIFRKDEKLLDRTISLLKTSRVSLNTGIITTFLKNPENITPFVKQGGDTTLVADNPNSRVMVTIMLTFHFRPRNLDIKPRNLWERFGLTVGTNFSGTTIANNYFFGANCEIANGLFINGGMHLGEVNYIVNHESFNYGVDKFSGNFMTKQKWASGLYLSVSIDANLFKKAFNYSPQSNN